MMKATIQLGLAVSLGLVLGCSSSDSTPAPAQPVADSSVANDSAVDSGSQSDAGSDGEAADATPDAGETDAGASDGEVADGAADTGADAAAAFLGQCRVSSDCKAVGELTDLCIQMWPGGMCSCEAASDCGDETKFECLVKQCFQKCSGEGGCAPGMYCSDKGRCMPSLCGADAGGAECVKPYVCKSGKCARPMCQDAGETCPTGTHCEGGRYCVEN